MEVEISDVVLLHQWQKVLRFHIGEQVKLFDNSGQEFVCEIISLDKKSSRLKVLSSKLNVTGQLLNVSLYFSLIKKDRMEWLLEKCTELGVSHFKPIISERSEKKGFNLERAKKIIQEACEQSGRAVLPTVSEPSSLREALTSVSQSYSAKALKGEPAFAFDSSGSEFSSLRSTLHVTSFTFFVGPEGGFTPNEIEMFKQAGIKIYSLGSATLRAETAAAAVASLLLLK